VRIIAATHQNLEQRVKDGTFREDLFHRLNVIRLRLPSLRNRQEDIPVLIKHFLVKSAQQLGGEPKRISEAALQRLAAFSFPGNVRQLENVCHWLTVMAPSQVVEIKDLPQEVTDELPGALDAGLSHEPAAAPVGLSAAWGGESQVDWTADLYTKASALLQSQVPEVWDVLARSFEKTVIQAGLDHTKGRRIDAALRLGIGRNTITRKIQDLGMDDTPA
jgi:two-component system nitrogen regulation response regulator GlnG